MSDPVKCDSCGKTGRRRLSHTAPDKWYYVELQDEDSLDVLIVYACSLACTALPWQCGPGRLADGLQPGVKSPTFRLPTEQGLTRLVGEGNGDAIDLANLKAKAALADALIERMGYTDEGDPVEFLGALLDEAEGDA